MRRAAFALALLAASAADAHKPSDSYLALEVRGARIEGQWDVAVRDLDDAVGLDDDDDGAVTWGELRAHRDFIFALALSRLQVDADGVRCGALPGALQVDAHSDGSYAVLRFAMVCPAPPVRLEVAYSLLFDIDPTHRGLLRLAGPGGTRMAIFSPSRNLQVFELSAATGLRQFASFVHEGVLHIWTGYDHVLFLLALLFPAVLRREEGRWVPVASFGAALAEVLKVVTMFTLAHSITLSLAVLGLVRLPSRWVESGIALSVLLAALNNLRPVLRGRAWTFAFGFGLLHGFGFASVLADMELPRAGLARALFGFNVGVELGQLAIVAGFLGLAFALRRTWAYQRVVVAAGSAAIAGLACVWLAQRAFDLRLSTIF